MTSSKKTMAKVVRLLNRFEVLSCCTGGHDSEIAKAYAAKKRLLDFIKKTIEDMEEEIDSIERHEANSL